MADDALTNLNWLMVGESPLGPQNPPTPPTTPPDNKTDYQPMMGDYVEYYNGGFGRIVGDSATISFHHSFPLRSTSNRKQRQNAGRKEASEAGEPQIDYKSERVKPPYSYAQLISMAMQSHGGHKVVLTDIYVWIKDNFAYFRGTDNSWQNSIRHNLSLNRQFVKVPRDQDDKGKGSYWMLDPKSFRKDPYCIRRRNFFETHSKKPKRNVDRPQVNPAVKNFLEKSRIRHHPFGGTVEKLEDIGAQECVYSNAVIQHDDASGFNQKLFKEEVETYSVLSSGVVVSNNNYLHQNDHRTILPTTNNNERLPQNDLIVTASLPSSSDSSPLTTLVNVQQQQQQPITTATFLIDTHQNNGPTTISSSHYVPVQPESGSFTNIDGNNGEERVKVEFNWEGYEYHPSNVLSAQLPTIHLSSNNDVGSVPTCGSLSPPNSDKSDGGGVRHHHHHQGNNGITTTALDLLIPGPEIPDWWSSTGSITGGGLLSPPHPPVSASNACHNSININCGITAPSFSLSSSSSSSCSSSSGVVIGDPLARVFELRQLHSTASLSTPSSSSSSGSSTTTVAAGTTTPSTKMDAMGVPDLVKSLHHRNRSDSPMVDVVSGE